MVLPESRYGFSSRRKSKKILRNIILLISLIIVIIFIIFIINVISRAEDEEISVDNREQSITIDDYSLRELWKLKKYDEINLKCEKILIKHPLDLEALSLNGFSYFYRGISKVSLDDQVPFYTETINNLRKAALIEDNPILDVIHYVLGKAYFHKGRYYLDSAIKHLEKAYNLGIDDKNIFNYLGLAFSDIGQYEKSINYFLMVGDSVRSDIYYLTLGQTYLKDGNFTNAETSLLESVKTTEDINIVKRARFLLGKLYLENQRYNDAEKQYREVLNIIPNSADAHYYLGEIYFETGNRVKARAEWRKALEIDPSHYGALLRLY